MDIQRPAQLSYLVIFNPTLRPPLPTDDEDDIEQASILLYTARSRAVSRDTMLRQVGLAKALINFSELFTPEAGCDNVHSHKKRLVMFSPEPDFWMHVCIDLPSTKRESSRAPKAASKAKGKEAAKPSNTDQLDYIDNSLYDRILRDDLKVAYEGFRIAYGTFGEILRDEGSSALEGRLEQYFNMWAWQWDSGATPDLPLHLGIPLHHQHQKLRACLDEIFETIPSTFGPFVLQHEPFAILNLPRSPAPPDLYALIRYVLTLSRIPIPPSSHVESITGHISLADSSATLLPHAISPPPFDPISRANGALSLSTLHPGPISHLSSTMAAPFTHAGSYLKPTLDVVNPKKWWPGYLTIQKSTSRPDLKDFSPETEPKPGVTPPNDPEYSDREVKPANDSQQSKPSDNISKGNSDPSEMKQDGSTSRLPPPIEPSAKNHHLDIDQEALEDAMIDTTPPQSDMDSDMETYPPLPPSPPLPPPFTSLPVRMIRASNPPCTEQRTLLHIPNHGFSFALLLPPGQHEYDINDNLGERVDNCLKALRSILDNPSMTDLLQPGPSSPSRGVLFDEGTSTTTVVPAPPYGEPQPHIFAACESLQGHPWLQEVISRNTSSGWIASRKSPAPIAGGMAHKIAFLEAGNAQASLVDVDSELSALIRQ